MATPTVKVRIFNGGVQVGEVNAGVEAFTVPGLTANTTYTFTVRAVDAEGLVSPDSNTITVTTSTAPPTTINSPTGLNVQDVTQTAATLTWTWTKGQALDVDDFQVRTRVHGASTWSTPQTIAKTARSAPLTGLSAGTAYEAEVTARHTTPATSSAPVIVPFTTTAAPTTVAPVTDLDEVTHTQTAITVSWAWVQDGGLAATGFDVSYRTPPATGTWSTAVNLGAVLRQYQFTGLTAATDYELRVVAKAGATESTPTTITDRTLDPVAPPVPGNLTLTESGTPDSTDHRVDWSWDAPAGGADEYELEWGSQWGPDPEYTSSQKQAGTTFGLVDAASGAVYSGRVRARKGTLWSTWSAKKTLSTTSNVIAEPANVQLEPSLNDATHVGISFYQLATGIVPTTFECYAKNQHHGRRSYLPFAGSKQYKWAVQVDQQANDWIMALTATKGSESSSTATIFGDNT